jgi:hypothetical protein
VVFILVWDELKCACFYCLVAGGGVVVAVSVVKYVSMLTEILRRIGRYWITLTVAGCGLCFVFVSALFRFVSSFDCGATLYAIDFSTSSSTYIGITRGLKYFKFRAYPKNV